MVDKITPTDPRIQWKTTTLQGVTYEYILAEPPGPVLHTIFLVHGWPDLAFGWRYQIPLLTSLGLRVVAPNMMGYGGTDAPKSLEFYTFKRASDDLAALAQQLGLSSIILAGHDWGGSIVYRFALWYPKLISAVITVCTPFAVPRKEYIPMTSMPNFKYQLQFASGDIEQHVVGEARLRQLLCGMYGGRTATGETTFDVSHGCYLDRLDTVGPSPLLSDAETDFYVKSYARTGLHGPLNWYRTGELNWRDEIALANAVQEGNPLFDMPFLFIGATRDGALPPAMSQGMEVWFRSLTRGLVQSSHWALWEQSEEVNRYIREFLAGQIRAPKAIL